MDVQENTPQTIPQDHHCIELNLHGQPCGLPASAGRDRCYIHGIYRATDDGRCTIDIPLLEDPKAILYVYSQVARALAHGAMPAANANGIIRCCKGAQRLLEEQWKRERFEERRRARQSSERRAQGSENGETANPRAEAKHTQADATVPCDLEGSACAENGTAAVTNSAVAAVLPEPIDPANTLQAALSAEQESGPSTESPEPQPWNVEPPLPVVPPPQFADAPDKFQHTLDRINGKQFEAIRNRDRAIRARGGSVLKFYEGESQGVRSEIRDTF